MTSKAREDPVANAAIHSTFANDPDMRELIELFVSELPEKVAELRRAADAGDLASLRRMTHTLRGTCGGYGFAGLSDSAGRIEELVKGQAKETQETLGLLDKVRADVRALIQQCSRVSANAGA